MTDSQRGRVVAGTNRSGDSDVVADGAATYQHRVRVEEIILRATHS